VVVLEVLYQLVVLLHQVEHQVLVLLYQLQVEVVAHFRLVELLAREQYQLEQH
jgi:hypothetical protein